MKRCSKNMPYIYRRIVLLIINSFLIITYLLNSPVTLLQIFKAPFHGKPSRGLLLAALLFFIFFILTVYT